jgi:hypothetical protein
MKQYCIYTHSIDDVVFYVGCAKLRKEGGFRERHVRVFEKSKRSKYWKDYVKGREFVATIVNYYDTQNQAFNKEIELISYYGRYDLGKGTLVNVCKGGNAGTDSPFLRAIPIIQYDLLGNIVREWPSIKSIQKETGYLRTNIVKCCRKKQVTAYGYKWSYKNDPFKDVKPNASKKGRLNKYRPDLESIGVKINK